MRNLSKGTVFRWFIVTLTFSFRNKTEANRLPDEKYHVLHVSRTTTMTTTTKTNKKQNRDKQTNKLIKDNQTTK